MNKSLVIGLVIGALVVTAGAALGGLGPFQRGDQYAQVVKVDPISKKVSTPREVCEDKVVTQQQEPKDQKRIAGTVIGAVVGGVVGHQVGSGRGNDLATAAGAAAGGYAGNRVQKRVQDGKTYTTTERQCRTEYDSHSEVVGYNVQYKLDGRLDTIRLDHDPGSRIQVKDGELMVNAES